MPENFVEIDKSLKIESLKNTIKHLNARLEKFKYENDELKSKLASYHRKITSMNSGGRDKLDPNSKRFITFNKMKYKYKTLETEVVELRKEIKKFKNLSRNFTGQFNLIKQIIQTHLGQAAYEKVMYHMGR